MSIRPQYTELQEEVLLQVFSKDEQAELVRRANTLKEKRDEIAEKNKPIDFAAFESGHQKSEKMLKLDLLQHKDDMDNKSMDQIYKLV